MRGNLFTSNKTEARQVKMTRIKHALMKMRTIGDAPNNLHEACTKNKTEFRPPMILGTHRRSLKVIKSELFPLTENAITEEFKDKCFNYSKEPMINSNGDDAKADAPVNKNEEVFEAYEDVVPNTLSEIIPNENNCPKLHHFNIPFGNEQCINNLLVELFSC